MKYFKLLLISLAIITLMACSKKEPVDYAYKIMFMEQDQFAEPYPTRVIVTPKFVRFDDGDGAEDFIVFDRMKSLVHSVVADEQTVMTVHKKSSKIESPIKLIFSEKDLGDMSDAPKVGGKQPRHYQLLVNDKVCSDLMVVEGLLPAAVEALKEFSIVMASDSKMTLSSTPADLINACDLAKDTFAPTRQLMFGFPVHTMGQKEYVRTLVDFDENYKIDKKLFVVPVDYKHYTVQELREGKVKFDK